MLRQINIAKIVYYFKITKTRKSLIFAQVFFFFRMFCRQIKFFIETLTKK